MPTPRAPIRRSHTAQLLLLGALLPACAIYSQVRSPLRAAPPRSVALSDAVQLTATGAVNIHVPLLVDHQDLLPASFRIDAPGQTIYLDPVLIDDPRPAELILIGHDHGDHLSLPDLDALRGPRTRIVCSAAVAAQLGDRPHRVLRPGESLELDGLRIQGVPAYNLEAGALGMTPHSRDAGHLGFVIELAGLRIYHAGDSDVVPEMRALGDIDVVLLPIGEGDLTMTTREAAELVNLLRPRRAIPMHYTPGQGDAERFRAAVDPAIAVTILE